MADRLARLGRALRPPPLPVAGGLLAALGHPPFAALWLALPGLALVLHGFLRRGPGWRGAFGTLWWAGFGYFGLSLSWIVQPFFVDPVRHGWMSPFAILLLAGGLALFWGLAGVVADRIGGRLALWAVVPALTAAELLRAYMLTGFPWATLGHVWIGWPGMQLAAWIGAGGLTLLALAAAALAAPLRPARVAAGLALALAATALGAWRQAQPLPPDRGPVVRLIQPNIAQSLKWDPATAESTLADLIGLTAATADPALGPPALVAWPETALPYLYDGPGPLLTALSEAAAAPVLMGAQRVDGLRAYNSVVEVRPGGIPGAVYDKHHPVPFGEYIPFQPLLAGIGLRAFTAREGYGFTAGPGPQLMDLGAAGRMLPLICYEVIFPQGLRTAERPDWLFNATNDAWFGTFSGPYQHLAQAQLRAVEYGLPLLRAANTGVSAVIDPHGTVRARLPLGVRGHLDAPLPAALPPTLYARTGDLPLALLLAALLAGLALAARRKSH